MSPAAPTTGARCAVTRADRVSRGIAAAILAATILVVEPVLWCAIPAAICATLLTVGAVTGWCPTDLLPSRRSAGSAPNGLGLPEALQDFDLRSR